MVRAGRQAADWPAGSGTAPGKLRRVAARGQLGPAEAEASGDPPAGMAGASAPGRKRSGPPGPRPGPLPIPGHPPSKRARSFPEAAAAAAAPDPEDPFGEHGDFTADDLEELDILASQALSQCPPAPREVTSECPSRPPPAGQCSPPGRSCWAVVTPGPLHQPRNLLKPLI